MTIQLLRTFLETKLLIPKTKAYNIPTTEKLPAWGEKCTAKERRKLKEAKWTPNREMLDGGEYVVRAAFHELQMVEVRMM